MVKVPFIANSKWVEVFRSVFLDTCVHMPFIYLPLFYFSRDLALTGGTLEDVVARSKEVYYTNVLEDFKMNASVFTFTQTFNFSCNPPHWRVPFQCAMGIIWLAMLSYHRGDKKED